MGFFKKIFGKENASRSSNSDKNDKERQSEKRITLPDVLAKKGDMNIRDVIKSCSSNELQKIINELPIESLILDSTACSDVRLNDRLFQICIQFSSVLANYDSIRNENPDFKLPVDLPAFELSKNLIPRFVEQIKAQNTSDIFPAAGQEIFIFAQDLIKGGWNHEAFDCLSVCENIPGLNKNEVVFWSWASLHNIATKTKVRKIIKRALEASKKIPAGRREEVAKAIEWERKQLFG
ncbi:MAG: hypothetical protein ABIK92_13770 [Pseudomonadota bacterium]